MHISLLLNNTQNLQNSVFRWNKETYILWGILCKSKPFTNLTWIPFTFCQIKTKQTKNKIAPKKCKDGMESMIKDLDWLLIQNAKYQL